MTHLSLLMREGVEMTSAAGEVVLLHRLLLPEVVMGVEMAEGHRPILHLIEAQDHIQMDVAQPIQHPTEGDHGHTTASLMG
jgi:hypothetical protein